MRTLGPRDDGTSVTVGAGETVVVRLPENASTGYRWQVSGGEMDNLELLPGSTSYPDRGIGSGGDATFAVRALRAGTARLVLERRRSWTDPSAAVETFEVEISVED